MKNQDSLRQQMIELMDKMNLILEQTKRMEEHAYTQNTGEVFMVAFEFTKTLDTMEDDKGDNQDNPNLNMACGVEKLKSKRDDEHEGGGRTGNRERKNILSNMVTQQPQESKVKEPEE
ncbi:uncharacterized protein LOC120079469 [Benincasa hispida]|uniref:uncharacterized protein LOC120079469 n=1 Tax=Benincasa hispida TaxID=102211 RepID=UPI0019020B3E|nr:uncharacterized protein LOC120079469 [Benincasa hispida]